MAAPSVEVTLATPAGSVAAFARWLSEDERQRLARLHHHADQLQYAVAHSLRRAVLATYVGGHPEALVFLTDPGGRQRLAAGPAFSLSRRRGLVCVAVAPGLDAVGVDIEETTRPDFDDAAAFFTPEERAVLAGLEPVARRARFFRMWTIKEAWLKARGEGLPGGLDQVDTLAPSPEWTVTCFTPDPQHLGALVAPGACTTQACWATLGPEGAWRFGAHSRLG